MAVRLRYRLDVRYDPPSRTTSVLSTRAESRVVKAAAKRTLGWSLTAGAGFGAAAFALVVLFDLANPTFAPDADFVVTSTGAGLLAGSVLWWRAVERPGVLTRERAAAVGATVGFVGPTLTFAFNPSVYGDNPNVAVDVLGALVAAGVLGLQGLLHSYLLPVFLGAATGWSIAGWFRAFRD